MCVLYWIGLYCSVVYLSCIVVIVMQRNVSKRNVGMWVCMYLTYNIQIVPESFASDEGCFQSYVTLFDWQRIPSFFFRFIPTQTRYTNTDTHTPTHTIYLHILTIISIISAVAQHHPPITPPTISKQMQREPSGNSLIFFPLSLFFNVETYHQPPQRAENLRPRRTSC